MLQKVLFRFCCIYFGLYFLPLPLGFLWDPAVHWTGRHILHLGSAITVKPNGSGDTTYNYVQVLVMVLVSLAGCLVWSLADHKRASYRRLKYWLMVYLRYSLAIALMSYGFYKIFKSQFPFPSLIRLLEPYGQSSPMGLAWTFMGYSTAFNFFTGFFEALGGFLLFFRRTTLLGACIAVGVMGNVVMMNFCYDIPVKLYSSNLLLAAIFILLQDFPRLTRLFILNRTAPPADIRPVFTRSWSRWTRIVLKGLLILLFLYRNISGGWQGLQQYGDNRQRPPLYGIYEVETFVRGRDTLPPLLTDTLRWRRLIIDYPGYATVQRMDERGSVYYGFRPDTLQKTVLLFSNPDTATKYRFRYECPDSARLVLRGKLREDSLEIMMRRKKPDEFLLVNRGFHWINEYPFNR
ncbi:hypothetical protein [Compostibacter hankyongensis]|uniref:DoxX family protein n=1 Tax=Compostibacter hankyongensis TaxID=1007089 RepID=A0ABP8FDA9_9BACT